MADLADEGEIVRITIAAAHSVPLVSTESIEAVSGKGLRGDRHYGNPARQVTIQSRQELLEAEQRFGSFLDPDLTRRNITLDAGLLPRARGTRLTLGTAVLEVFADAAPCALMEELHGPGAKAALKKLAGIHCRVVSSGLISVGDRVNWSD